MVRSGASGMMYDFYLYEGKTERDAVQEERNDYEHLQKSTQAVAKLCVELLAHHKHKLFLITGSQHWR